MTHHSPPPADLPFAILTPWGWMSCRDEDTALRVSRECARPELPAMEPADEHCSETEGDRAAAVEQPVAHRV